MIYLDNAATSLHKPEQVIEAVARAMREMGNSARGTHGSSLGASRIIFEAREKLANLFHCSRTDHVVFTANSTEALNMAICGTLNAGDHVISTDLEHNSVLRPLYRMEKERGIEVDFIAADKKGCIDMADFGRLLRPNTKAVVCTHASNLTGNLLDIGQIGEFAKANGLLFIVDASQTAGVFPIDMEAMHIDILCFTGHKGLLGPQGTGGLCLREGIEIEPWKVGGSGVQTYLEEHPREFPTRLEAGTLNGHGIAGLLAAIDFIQETGIEKIHAHEKMLMQRFYDGVSKIENVTVYGDFSTERAAVVALNIGEYDSGEVSDVLEIDYGIATRPGAHCAPRMHRALGTESQGAVRFSFGYFNTIEDVDAAIRAVEELAQ